MLADRPLEHPAEHLLNPRDHEDTPTDFAYMATFHPEISDGGGLVTSYSVNSMDGLSALQQNDHTYQPRFIEISG